MNFVGFGKPLAASRACDGCQRSGFFHRNIQPNTQLLKCERSQIISKAEDTDMGVNPSLLKKLWTHCDSCGEILYVKDLKQRHFVCSRCSAHLYVRSNERIAQLVDEGTFRPMWETLSPDDPLQFEDEKKYSNRLKDSQEKTGMQDAVIVGSGQIGGIPIAFGVMDFRFMGGSMGSVVGERITRLIEYATVNGLSLVLVCASGGARMQEGVLSLMQMAKISAALQTYTTKTNGLYVPILTSPTTGGVTASFAMLGDIIIAEPKALIGFAGQRVIEQTIGKKLPRSFQEAESLFDRGALDLIIERPYLKSALVELLTLYQDSKAPPAAC